MDDVFAFSDMAVREADAVTADVEKAAFPDLFRRYRGLAQMADIGVEVA
jgi:hypothetical protein